jgi:hypothetical protein
MNPFKVITKDVDGSTTRTYKNFDSAKKRFEAMSGHDLPLGINSVSEVSDYGTVVIFESSIDLSHMKPADPAAGMTDAEIFAHWRALNDSFESASEYACYDDADPVLKARYDETLAEMETFAPAYHAAVEREEEHWRKHEEDSIRLGLNDTRYGGEMHQMYGDAWLYQDCPGAW